jgi:hypothetical protein
MVIDKVTKEILMKFAVGDQKVFTMPNYNKARSAQSYANQLKNDKDTYGWQFKAIIGDPIEGTMARSLTITRLA